MEYRHGFETARNVAQIYETTIADTTSDLAAHIVTVPARSLGGSSYLFEGSDWPLEMLGLLRIADGPRAWSPMTSRNSCVGSSRALRKRPGTPARNCPSPSCSPSTSRSQGLSRSSSLRSRPNP